jgi:hypothetical protein
MSKRQVLDSEGKPIDPSANLGEFLQGIPQSDLEDVAAAAPTWDTFTLEVDDPELRGKTGKDALALLDQTRAKAKQESERAANLEQQLFEQRQKAEIETTTRRVLQEQQAKPPAAEPQIDPREAQIAELWWTDQPAAMKLIDERNDERARQIAKEAEERVIGRIDNEKKRDLSYRSFDVAYNTLKGQGIDLDQVKASAVLHLVNNPAQPYFANGGLYKPENIIHAARTLFGGPVAAAAATAAPTVATQAAPAQTAAPIVAPPGSGRPAPAAAPARARTATVDSRTQKDYEHMAEIFGHDPAKLLARRAARIEREGDH